MPTERPVIASAKRIGVTTLTSRVTGLVRDMLLVQTFGLSWVQDAFQYAFQFPNLFRRLFGEGAIAAAFVPTFARTIETEGRESAWRLLARTLALLTVTLVALIVLIEAVIAVIWLTSAAGDPQQVEARRLLLSLTALMLPFMLGICVVALFGSILNCLGSFVPAALTPVILNVLMIGGILWLGPLVGGERPQVQVYGVAISVLVAGVIQVLFILPVMRTHGVRLGWKLAPRDPQVRRVLGLMGPVALGQGVLAFGVFLDAQICILLTRLHDGPLDADWFGMHFAYPLSEGALSAVTVAQRLYQFPLGVIGISIATAALPMFSRLATREDWPGWAAELRGALRMTVFTGLLSGAMMIVLAEPIVRLLFEYRSFGPADTTRAARVLACYGAGMWAFCAQHIVLRALYSVGDVRTPLKISCLLMPFNVALSLVLVWLEPVREAAFGVSTALTSTIAVVAGLAILQRREHARVVNAEAGWAAGRMLLAAVICGVAVYFARRFLAAAIPAETASGLAVRAADTLGSLTAGCAIFLLLSWVLRLPEARLLLHPGSLIRKRPGGEP